MNVYKRSNGIWYVSFYDETRSPKKKRISLKTRDKKQAYKKATHLEMQKFTGDWDPWAEEVPTRRTLRDGCDRALQERYDQREGVNFQNKRSLLNRICRWFGEDTRIENISTSDVRKWLFTFDNQNTRHDYYWRIHALFEWFKQRKWIKHNPVSQLETPKRKRVERTTFSKRQYHQVQKRCRYPNLTFATCLMWHTGLRPGEARHLTWENVDLEKRILHVRKVKCPNYVWTPKDKKERSVPVPKPLSKRLKEWRGEYTDHVHDGTDMHPKFVNLSKLGNPISKSGFQKQWRLTRREIGLPKKLTLHCLRHTFATRMINAGMGVEKLQKILGHAQIETTQIYVHMSTRDIQNAVDSVYESMSG